MTLEIQDRKKRVLGGKKQDKIEKDRSQQLEPLQLDSGRQGDPSCHAVLKFSSRHGLENQKELKSAPDRWPGLEVKDVSSQPNFTEISLDSTRPNRLRSRKNLADAGAIFDPTRLLESPPDNLAAKGCIACFKLRIPCSFAENGKYPCQDCRDIGSDCELIVEPPQKRGCERCAHRRIVCSFRDATDNSGPCQQCQDKKVKCIAGPKSNRTKNRPSHNRSLANQNRLPRGVDQHIKSTKDSGIHARDSLGCEIEIGTCMKRASAGPETMSPRPEDASSTMLEPIKRRKISLTMKPPKAPDADLSSNSLDKHGVIKMIRTQLAHPIILNYEPVDNHLFPCHICNDLCYGILGLPERQVEVIDYQDGEGYIEIAGGHTGDGEEPTRLCTSCTESRLQIAKCSNHDLQHIPGAGMDNSECDGVLRWLQKGTATRAPFQWCSICPNAASYSCKTPYHGDCVGDTGCGLVLCDECAILLCSKFAGNLTRLIGSKEMDEDAMLKLRADALLLKVDGQIVAKFGGRRNHLGNGMVT